MLLYTVLIDNEPMRKFSSKEEALRFCENRKDVKIVRQPKPKEPSIKDILNDFELKFGPALF